MPTNPTTLSFSAIVQRNMNVPHTHSVNIYTHALCKRCLSIDHCWTPFDLILLNISRIYSFIMWRTIILALRGNYFRQLILCQTWSAIIKEKYFQNCNSAEKVLTLHLRWLHVQLSIGHLLTFSLKYQWLNPTVQTHLQMEPLLRILV